MSEFYTIQEFAKITGVEVSKLRFYDKVGVFSPIKREPENNYRYYSLAQIPALNFIFVLSALNIPLKTIAELKKERTPAELLKLLEKQEKQLGAEMRALQEHYSIIYARRELINYGMIVTNSFFAVDGRRLSDEDSSEGGIRVDENVITVLHREDKEYFLWPRNEYKEDDTFVQPLASLISEASDRRINLNFPVGGYWDNMEAFISEPSRPNHFFTIDPLGTKTREEGNYLIGFNRGYYGDMGDLPMKMNDYAKENALALSGPVWAMYMFDEVCISEPSEFLVQVCVAASKPRRRTVKS